MAVARGKDTAAALKCLDLLSEEQRQQVRTHRVDMGSAYPAACRERLKDSRAVTDRFHVAKKFNEAVDALGKKLTLRRKAQERRTRLETRKPFIGTLRVNESRPAEPGQQPEASLAWGGATLTAKRRQRVPRPCD